MSGVVLRALFVLSWVGGWGVLTYAAWLAGAAQGLAVLGLALIANAALIYGSTT